MNSQELATGNGSNGGTGTTDTGTRVHEPSAVPERRSGGVPVKLLKVFLLLVAWADFVWWFSLWFRMPSAEGKAFKKKVSTAIGTSTFWGKYATTYVLYVVPVVGLALVALVYLELQERFPDRPKPPASGKQSFLVNLWRSVWTQPLLVKTPVGIITLIDIVIFVIVTVCTLWIWFDMQAASFHKIDHSKPKKGDPSKVIQKWAQAGAMLGRALPFVVACLFVPVARGSPLLRLVDVPFEQAIKYHRWFGYLTAVLVFIHGGTFAISLGLEHKLHLLRQWPKNGDSNLPGVFAGSSVVIMALTAIPYVRTRNFNFFFTVHHLYIAFFIFYVFHVDMNHTASSMGPILLFFIDRFLRMVQSWEQVTGVSARVLPSGIVELKIPKQTGFKYNALSFIYINVPGISKLQWHPFSTTSSILDDSNEITLCIKRLGDWTGSLHDNFAVQPTKASGCPFAVKTVHTEGPYGHESNFFLRYKNLVLIAGGAGVTPFLAVIQDLLKRHHLLQDYLPTNVHLIWCARRREELTTLNTIKPADIYPNYTYRGTSKAGTLNLTVQAYVTGEPVAGEILPTEPTGTAQTYLTTPTFPDSPQKEGSKRHNGMSTVNSVQNLWMIALIVASTMGFVLMHALQYNYVSSPKFLKKGEKFSTAEESVLHFVSLFVGIVVCGGSVIFFWIASTRAGRERGLEGVKMEQVRDLERNGVSDLLESCAVTEGKRPQFEELFDEVAGKYEGEEVGVLVCGPGSLQESVAVACRARNFESLMKTSFHYHSVSFDL